MSAQIHNIEQGTPEWRALRAGVPTASSFSKIMAKGQGKVRRDYLLKLAGEVLTGEPAESYSNAAMERGHEMEPQARANYAFIRGVDPVEVGFVTNGRFGCSPDALIGYDGGLEIKSTAPHILIDITLRDRVPPEHKAQIQGGMWVCERGWWDFVAFWPGLAPYVTRIPRDDEYIKELETEANRFIAELDEIVGTMRDRMEVAA